MTDCDPTLPSPGGDARRPHETGAGVNLVGRQVKGFYVRRRLGGGAMGDVYLAEQDLGAGRKLVALKTIRARYRGDDEAIRRFQLEALAGGTLKTSYVAQVIDYGVFEAEKGGTPLHFLAMEYCSGGTLLDYMASFEGHRLPVEECIRLLRQACEGFLAAERRVTTEGKPDPLVHRDIKPANLLLQKLDGTDRVDIRIADFGAVKRHRRNDESSTDLSLTRAGAPMTPGYASPEQWEFDEVDHRSDMYSLGATFYHALTGQRATPESEQLGMVRKFVLQTPCLSPKTVLENVPDPLNKVIARMTARRREDRYRSFADIIAELAVFEQRPASTAKAWITAAVLVAAIGAAAWCWLPGESYRAADVLADYGRLQQRVDAAEAESPWLAELPELQADLARVERDIEAQRGELRELIRSRGDDAVVPAETLKQRLRCETGLDPMVARLEAAKKPLQDLAALADETTGLATLSREAATKALAGIAEPDGLTTIRAQKRRLSDRIERLYEQREGTVRLAERDFTAFDGARAVDAASVSDRFRPLQNRAAELREAVAVEPALVQRLDELAAAIAAARGLEERIPRWSPGESDPPATQLEGFLVALQSVGEIEQPPVDGLLHEWWRRRRAALAEDWRPIVLDLIDRDAADVGKLVTQLQGMERDAAEAALRDVVLPAWKALKGRFTRLAESMQRARSPVFTANDQLAIRDRAQPGPPPTLDYSVATLRAAYLRTDAIAQTVLAAARTLGADDGQLQQEVGAVSAEAKAAVEALEGLDVDRIAAFPGHDLPRELDRRLALQVRSAISGLGGRFRRDELALADSLLQLRDLEQGLTGWDADCRLRAEQLRKRIERAQAMLERYEARIRLPDPDGLTTQRVAEFKGALDAVAAMRGEPVDDEDLDAWRVAWSERRLRDLVAPIGRQLESARADLRGVIEAFLQRVPELAQLEPELGETLRKSLRTALKVIDLGAAPQKPDGWSDAAWRVWPDRVAVPSGLEAELRGDRLVCWFPFRKLRTDANGQRPVEMLLVAPPDQAPFLVDVHEVCVGELLALGVQRGVNDPGDYLQWREANQWRDIRRTPSALLSRTSHKMAEDYAASAYASAMTIFELPTPAQWQFLASGDELPARAEVTDPAAVRTADLDELRGVRGLRSGLAEWLRDGSVAGRTDYAPSSLTGVGEWKKGVGFRCVFNLK